MTQSRINGMLFDYTSQIVLPTSKVGVGGTNENQVFGSSPFRTGSLFI
jgi:hypothetical protein